MIDILYMHAIIEAMSDKKCAPRFDKGKPIGWQVLPKADTWRVKPGLLWILAVIIALGVLPLI